MNFASGEPSLLNVACSGIDMRQTRIQANPRGRLGGVRNTGTEGVRELRHNDNDQAVGRRALYWFAQAAIRMRGDQRLEAVAALADVSAAVLYRFERAESWPRELGRVSAAYAQVGGLDDGRALWQSMLDLWYQHGSAPLIGREEDQPERRPSQQTIDAIRLAAQRERARADAESPPTSTRKKRATGG